jgi:hypothetical protein
MANVLFKFCSGAGAISILKGNSIFITSPLDLNDPFEMRPGWTDEHQNRHFQDEQLRSQQVVEYKVQYVKSDHSYINFMQEERAKTIAYAKNHSEVCILRKGVMFIDLILRF